MNSGNKTISWLAPGGIGIAVGFAISAVDNFAFDGEVSPVLIVALLLGASATFGIIWGWRGWTAMVSAWICVPLAHLIKHLLGLPDTLNPNTYTSILMLAGFTLVVSAIGFSGGIVVRKVTNTRCVS